MKKLKLLIISALFLIGGGNFLLAGTSEWCEKEIYHFMNPVETASKALLTISAGPEVGGSKTLHVCLQTPSGTTDKVDYIYINSNNAFKTNVFEKSVSGGADKIEENIPLANGVTTANLGIQWSKASMGGNWCLGNGGCQNISINVGDVCSAPSTPSITTTPSSLTFSGAGNQNVVVKGANLTKDITVTSNSPANFLVNSSSSVVLSKEDIMSSDGATVNVSCISQSTVSSSISFISDEITETVTVKNKLSECTGSKGHFATPDNKKIKFSISYSVSGVTITMTPYNSERTIDYAEVQCTDGVGSSAMTIAADGKSATKTINTSTSVFGIRFLYSLDDFGGNEMTAENLNLSDANIIYYVLGACEASTPSIELDENELSFFEAGQEKVIKVTGSNLNAPINIESSLSAFTVSPTQIPAEGGEVTVTCASETDQQATISFTSGSTVKSATASFAAPKEIVFTSSCKIENTGIFLYFNGYQEGTYAHNKDKYEVSINSSKGAKTIRVENPAGDYLYCVMSGIAPEATEINTVTLKYKDNGDTGTITFKGTSVLNPSMSVTPTEWICMAQGATKEFTVTAEALKQDISITSSSDKFTLSTPSISKDATFPQNFTVTCATFAAGESETITLTSGSLTKTITIDTQNPEPTMSVSPSELSLNGKHKSGVITLSAQYLTSNVSVYSDDGAFTVDKGTITKEEANDGDVDITVTSNAAGDATATITIESGTLSKKVDVTYTAPKEIVFKDGCFINGAQLHLLFDGYGVAYDKDLSKYEVSISSTYPPLTGVYLNQSEAKNDRLYYVMNAAPRKDGAEIDMTTVTLTYENGDTGVIQFKGWERYIPQPFNHGLYDADNATVTTDFHSSGWGEDTESSAEIVGDGDIKVNIVPAKDYIWQGQVKLQTGITTLDPSKVYSLSFKMKSTKNCGGVTIKMFDDHAMLYGERAITLTANTEYVYNMTDIVNTYTSTDGILVLDFGYAQANTDIDIYDIAIFAEEPSVFTELFDIENATICKVEPSSDNPPEAVIDTENGTINIELKAYRGWQWGNQVHVCTGITTLNPNAEYKFKFTAVASTDNCTGVTFKAFDDNELVYRNADITLKTTPYNYESDWIKPNSANTAGAMVFDFGWDPVQYITISNISILEKVKAVQNESQEKSYSNLADAIEEAASGDRIAVNVDLDESVTIDKYIKINSNGKSVGNVTIDLTGKLEITGATNFNTLIVKSKPNVGAGQVFTSGTGSATASEVYLSRNFRSSFMQYWYTLAMPVSCNAESGLYTEALEPIKEGVWFMNYIGQNRAEYGVVARDQVGYCWDYTTELIAGNAYMIYMNEGINTVLFKANNPAEVFNPGKSISYTHFTGAAGDKQAGWNFLAQPLLTNAKAASDAAAWGGLLQVLKDGGNDSDGEAGKSYYSTESSLDVMAPFVSFVFQADKDGNLNFTADPGEAVIKSAEEDNFPYSKVVFADAESNSDNLFVSVSEDASVAGYEIGKDLLKAGSSSSRIQITSEEFGDELTAIDAKVVNGEAIVPLLLNAPKSGVYSISLDGIAQNVDAIYVQRNGIIVGELTLGQYNLDLASGLNKEYSLLVKIGSGVYTNTEDAVTSQVYVQNRTIYVDGKIATGVTNILGQSVNNPVPVGGVYYVNGVKIGVE